MNLLIKLLDLLVGLLDTCPMLRGIFLPAIDLVLFPNSPSSLCVQLIAELAFLADWLSLHDEFHAARFTGPILSVAVLPEMTPFPVTTSKTVLIEETHVSDPMTPSDFCQQKACPLNWLNPHDISWQRLLA